uniref:Transmembrane protein 222 n=1 Tax=Chromera velia CCMP2878 TaxID=1169474 RepID=A0A0G4F0A4_9ALVE|mmetsp:Transcript_20524/g.41027  ORF Transcript_20524/g.41027 Transcript_20524/m.41027 type:complete len:207 (-) Transcript_20524:127-747(-)|eukprot:Cvel_14483.t1-p1 / transcript=Cvel_14483.t1 / gene=Cvel_14483 / organism=Chromera_velia_CCMP2878 / gene_product=Transmembrane protein 222, putative / transcript_product=Transmembrane protein 222, putative / location=Cvel_scaffold1032:25594-28591(-) / protein_length=206 / sequence_SO=supercontig / SO=protein_coding / is_pseudo=false
MLDHQKNASKDEKETVTGGSGSLEEFDLEGAPSGGDHLGLAPIDTDNDLFPYCIVWTPLPMVSWIFPFIGHTGICTSEGVIHDFAGPYTISVGEMTFSRPTKFVSLQKTTRGTTETVPSHQWDNAIQSADSKYGATMHNICCNNCHHHVAHALNEARCRQRKWNMVSVGLALLLEGEYVGTRGVPMTWGPPVIFWLLFCLIWVFAF